MQTNNNNVQSWGSGFLIEIWEHPLGSLTDHNFEEYLDTI